MSEDFMKAIWARKEVQGMRATALVSVKGLMTTLRVLPEDLYDRVMNSDESVPKGTVFEEIVNRFGTPESYEKASNDAGRPSREVTRIVKRKMDRPNDRS